MSKDMTIPQIRFVMGGCSSVLFALGSLLVYTMFIEPLRRVINVRAWQSTSCDVISSRVQSSGSRRRAATSYTVELTYGYTVGGQNYVGTRYSFTGWASGSYGGTTAVVARLPAGTRTECWFDPANPSDAVIDRGLSAGSWWAVIFLLIMIAGGVGLYAVVFGDWKNGALSRLHGTFG
jgi:hypothetical protein